MNQLAYWLALQGIEGVGPVLFNQLISIAGSPQAVFEQAHCLGEDGDISPQLLSKLTDPDLSAFDATLEWAERPQNHLLTRHDPRYPKLLNELDDAPPLLYVRGNVEILSQPQIAVVGSRNPTSTGQQIATEMARHFSCNGITATSGLALGIDTAAHRGAVAQKAGTIAVMGTGVDRIYPARNRKLAHEIVECGGALVAEFPLGTPPLRENFPQRNRIISGLSLGTLVVEAAKRSGSLITARLAAEQGREVFAIPGSIHNPLAKGCHHLIRQGAKLVETAEHILEELAQFTTTGTPQIPPPKEQLDLFSLDPGYQSVLTCVGFEPTAIDAVVSRSGLTANEVSSMLLVLELQDYLQSHTGGYYSRK